ncbi:MAG: histidine kinase [Imperialibacter sp.]|uniref:sensor histidine kinase n=1 Tax=Imperialibacter sp. TaxID=2038411 RepID=UPI0032F03189
MKHSSHLSRIDDRTIRWIGIPAFGIFIPNFTGLFGDLWLSDGMYWFGYIYFIFISWSIWQGNRWLLFKQRENMDWFSSPVRKLIILVAANVFYTAPVSVALIVGWYWFSRVGPVDWDAVQLVSLANVICVIFVTHAYETVFLIKERQTDLLAFEQLERARVEAELEILKSQIDPHFMFNSLNTLAYLIENDRDRALQFNESLSDVYRYILMNKQKELVSLEEEIAFANSYFTLVRIRFGDGVHFDIDIADESNKLMAPISLQLLLENAVKHNEFSEKEPLVIRLRLINGWVEVVNNLQAKRLKGTSRIGLRNLTERYRLLTGKEVLVEETEKEFKVKLPYLEV